MKVEVSIGEAIDKLSILELKLLKITNTSKITEIQKEIQALKELGNLLKLISYFLLKVFSMGFKAFTFLLLFSIFF